MTYQFQLIKDNRQYIATTCQSLNKRVPDLKNKYGLEHLLIFQLPTYKNQLL